MEGLAEKVVQVFTFAHFFHREMQEIYAYNVTGNHRLQLVHVR